MKSYSKFTGNLVGINNEHVRAHRFTNILRDTLFTEHIYSCCIIWKLYPWFTFAGILKIIQDIALSYWENAQTMDRNISSVPWINPSSDIHNKILIYTCILVQSIEWEQVIRKCTSLSQDRIYWCVTILLKLLNKQKMIHYFQYIGQ